MADTWQDRFIAGGSNPRLGIRFDETGRFLPEHGNTIVAQVIPGSATEAALVDLRASLMALPHAADFAFTAVESYHMTVFEGVIETRREAGYWPQDLTLDLDIDTMTRAMADKLEDFHAPPAFAMRLAEVTPNGLHLTGATPQDEATVRLWRDRLADALGFRSPNHDSYGFHTTMTYQKRWPPASALPQYQAALADLAAEFAAKIPVLHLARPNFCRFADMNAFPPVLPL